MDFMKAGLLVYFGEEAIDFMDFMNFVCYGLYTLISSYISGM